MEITTLEGNKLIAEFMGWGKYNDRCYNTPYDDADYCNGEQTSICDDSRLKFNSNWNWLMAVVEKIENTEDSIRVEIIKNSCDIYNYYGEFNQDQISFVTGNNKQEAVWEAVVEFIKWYNEQN